jgi:hypothetical protein
MGSSPEPVPSISSIMRPIKMKPLHQSIFKGKRLDLKWRQYE